MGIGLHGQFASGESRHRFDACFELCSSNSSTLVLSEFLQLLSLIAPNDDPVRDVNVSVRLGGLSVSGLRRGGANGALDDVH